MSKVRSHQTFDDTLLHSLLPFTMRRQKQVVRLEKQLMRQEKQVMRLQKQVVRLQKQAMRQEKQVVRPPKQVMLLAPCYPLFESFAYFVVYILGS